MSSVHQRYTKWKAIFDAKDSPAAKELPALTSRMFLRSAAHNPGVAGSAYV